MDRPAPPRPDLSRALPQGTALAVGIVGGVIGWQAGLPLPWMLGPMLLVTLAVLVGLPLRGPDTLRPVFIPVIGVMLGSSITPDVIAAAPRYVATILLLPPFLAAAATLSYVFYRRVGRYDPVTAWFSAMPGGLNDMLIMGGAMGGDDKRIALAHASRVLVVVTVVVLFFGAWFGVQSQGGGAGWTGLGDPSLLDYGIFAICAFGGVWLGRVMRLSAGQIVGPMILSSLAHLTGLVEVAPPNLSVIAAQVVIGTVIGCRFLGTPIRVIARDLALAAGSSAMMIAVAAGFAVAAARLSGVPVSQSFLAYSPGGLAEMGLLAFAMGQDVAYVTVMHIVRLILVIFAATPLFSRLVRPRAG
ncbi:hypothetical protein SAMN05444417_2672 [Wenxinia saemankumensis]|uniref:Ammonia monooxygenase n=2 Tax=Wenxinia saemankumensis TaxID=1447782 RepID=A0A1M6G490_9RHOB|nr:hypothetical protein SAMN05444417_2672 [Wenxinia saemankumensis]